MRKRWIVLVIILCLLAVLVTAAVFGWKQYQSTFIRIDSVFYRLDTIRLDLSGTQLTEWEKLTQLRKLQELDLRDTGLTPEQHKTLSDALPDCEIRWSVPFQDTLLDSHSETITTDALTLDDLDALQYFPVLRTVAVSQPGSYEALTRLAETNPELELDYSVEIGGEIFGGHRTQIRLKDVDPAKIGDMLPYFPALETVVLTGKLPDAESLSALRGSFPEIDFRWEISLSGKTVRSQDAALDLSGISLSDTVAMEAAFPYLPNLEEVTLCGCGLTNEQLLSLRARWEDIRFIWNVEIGEHSFRTDVKEIDISGTQLQSVADIESLLPCFTELEQVVMSFCGISNPDMDALNRRYEDIKFVWTVYLGDKTLRTDATYYIPVKLGQQVTTPDIYNLRYCTDMISVDLGHMEVENIDFAAYMPHLKYLIIADTLVTSLEPLRGLKELIYLEAFVAPIWDYSPLLTCTALEDLNICYTYGQLDVILQMKWLKRLWWGGGHMYHAQNALKQALPNTQIDIAILWSTGNGWRKAQNYYDMRDLMGMNYMEQD